MDGEPACGDPETGCGGRETPRREPRPDIALTSIAVGCLWGVVFSMWYCCVPEPSAVRAFVFAAPYAGVLVGACNAQTTAGRRLVLAFALFSVFASYHVIWDYQGYPWCGNYIVMWAALQAVPSVGLFVAGTRSAARKKE